jgi:hypothetical protein
VTSPASVETLTEGEVEELERLAAESLVASPVPWQAPYTSYDEVRDSEGEPVADCNTTADAALIAAARNALPRLLATVRAQGERLGELERAHGELRHAATRDAFNAKAFARAADVEKHEAANQRARADALEEDRDALDQLLKESHAACDLQRARVAELEREVAAARGQEARSERERRLERERTDLLEASRRMAGERDRLRAALGELGPRVCGFNCRPEDPEHERFCSAWNHNARVQAALDAGKEA